MHDLHDIENLMENPLVMVQAIAFEDDASTVQAGMKSKTPQVK